MKLLLVCVSVVSLLVFPGCPGTFLGDAVDNTVENRYDVTISMGMDWEDVVVGSDEWEALMQLQAQEEEI